MINKLIAPLKVNKTIYKGYILYDISKNFDDLLFIFKNGEDIIKIFVGKKDESRKPYKSSNKFSIFIGNDSNIDNPISQKLVFIFLYIIKKNEILINNIDELFKGDNNIIYNQSIKEKLENELLSIESTYEINKLGKIISDLVGEKINMDKNIVKSELEDKYIKIIKKIVKNNKLFVSKSQYPKMLILELSYNCNLKCIMCNKATEKAGMFMEMDLYKKIIDEFGPEIKLLRLNGFGETFLIPHLTDYLEYLHKYKGKIKIEIINNGTIFNKKVIENFALLGADIWFSFDGGDKETFEKIRIGANFDKVCKNIKKIAEVYAKYGLYENLKFISVYQSSNIYNFEKILDRAHELGVKYILPATVNGDVEGNSINDIPFEIKLKNSAFRKDVFGKLLKFYEKAEKLGITLYNEDQIYGYEIGYPSSYPTNMTNQCQALEKEFFVGYDGKISNICNMHNPFHMGNLTKESFESIWNSISYRFIRAIQEEKLHNYKCSTCNWVNRYPKGLY